MIYPEIKTVFVHIPKTGGSSLEYWLGSVIDNEAYERFNTNDATKQEMNFLNYMYNKYHLENLGRDEKTVFRGYQRGIHRNVIEYKKFLGNEFDDYYSFSIVRNPFSQIRSFYNMDVTYSRKDKNLPSFEEFIMHRDFGRATGLNDIFDYKKKLSDENGKIIAKELFPFEDYQNVVGWLGVKFGFKPDFRVKLWSTSPDTDYTPEMIERVLDNYGDSYELWQKVKHYWLKYNKPFNART